MEVNDKAPDFRTTDENGKEVALKDFSRQNSRSFLLPQGRYPRLNDRSVRVPRRIQADRENRSGGARHFRRQPESKRNFRTTSASFTRCLPTLTKRSRNHLG